MKTEITKEEILKINPEITFSTWKDRIYLNFNGLNASKLWLDKAGKLHFEIGKGLNSSEANAIIEQLIGCDISDRYRNKLPYVVL